jgi:uracil-DNA glycosylase family 4
MTPVNKQAELARLATEVENLTHSPLYAYRQENHYQAVIGEGDPDASLMFIGEAPGEWEAKRGRPFVGASGKVLDELLSSIGLRRQEVYITNVVKDRPPKNRNPRVSEIRLYAPFLVRQMAIIEPRVVAPLGRVALAFVLNQLGVPTEGQSITRLHGQPLAAQASYGPVTVVPLYHPAVALYNSEQLATLQHDFQRLSVHLNAAPPPTSEEAL